MEDALAAKGVKNVTVGSGLRYDLFMKDPDSKLLLKKLVKIKELLFQRMLLNRQ